METGGRGMRKMTAEDHLYSLPDEFCIFVFTPRRLNLEERTGIARTLQAMLKERGDDIAPDRRPALEWKYPDDSQGPGLHLFTYRVGPAIKNNPDEAQKRRARVRELVAGVNTEKREWTRQLPEGSVAVALPQLLTVAAPNGYTGGGPGSAPDGVDATLTDAGEFGRFSFPNNKSLQKLVDEQRARKAKSSGVTVAILDAWPAGAPAGSDLAAKVAASLDASELSAVMGSGVNHQVKQRDLPYRPLPDHGLFVAGIVSGMAPAATLHPIRVLDDYCIGTASDLFDGVSRLRAIPGPLVVNLSLGFLPQDAVERLTKEFPATNLSAALFERTKIDDTVRKAEENNVRATMAVIFAALADRPQTLIVASAGNDATDPANRPLPEFPARYDWGISVAAVNSLKKPSKFSNRSEDRNPPQNGIAVFGGDVGKGGNSHKVANMPGSSRKKEAIAGLYSANTATASGTYKAGWAYWAGTSFAAPIISGIAAVLWGKNPGWSVDQVKQEILCYGENAANELNCQYITAKQDIEEP